MRKIYPRDINKYQNMKYKNIKGLFDQPMEFDGFILYFILGGSPKYATIKIKSLKLGHFTNF